MATVNAAPPAPEVTPRALAPGSLGVTAVVFFVLSSATPLTVVAGIVPTGYAATGVTGIPLAFLVVGAVLLLFSQGYVAMSRHVINAGAFYAYIARGIGRPAGVAAAWVALLSYNALQVGLYGAVGAAAVPLLQDWFGISPPWWVVALLCWALVAVLGVLRVELNGRVLAVLLLAEVAVITVFSVAGVLHPAGGHISLQTLSPGNLFVAGGAALGAVLAIGNLGFVGFESSAVFAEEARNPQRTVARATYTAVVVVAVLYAFASWAMSVAVGPDRVVAVAAEQGPETFFNLAGAQLGGWAVTVGHALFVTSIVAAMISIHNTVARYMFALGREQVLPSALGQTWARTQAPRAASLTQSVIAVAVIAVYSLAGWDPLLQLFYWFGTAGGLGVLLLLLTTSVAIIGYFTRTPSAERLWRRRTAPALASVLLAGITWLAFDNIAALLGVAPEHPLVWVIPTTFVGAMVLGLAYGRFLQTARPAVFARIGVGSGAAPAHLRPLLDPTTSGDDITEETTR